jgi:tetratricopeptide (TPR) repeat protein
VLWGNPALSAAAAILDSWGQAYGYDFSRLPDAASKAAAFRDLVANRRVLIVLDDLLSAESVRPLLPGNPSCAVILTTRNQEIAHALHAEILPLTPLAAESSRDLLGQLVGSARVAAEADAVDAICALLDHLPLAVEIAGQRLRARPDRRLADFADRLRSVQALLGELRISDRAVRTSFEASWQALDDDLRRSFAQLSLFAARPFDTDAFAAIAVLAAYDAEEAIFSLAALSLLIDAGGRRYRLHPLLADFAREKFADTADADEIWLRFARHFCEVAEKAAALAVDAPDWEHIAAGIQSAHDLGAHDLLFAYVDALLEPWRRQGHFTQARRSLSLAVSAARRGDDPQVTARYLREWGFFCLEQDDYAAAAPLLTEAAEIFAALDEASDQAETQLLQARMAVEQDDYPRAEAILRDCWAIFAGMDEGRGLARTLYWQGLVYYYQGKYDEAKQLQSQARSLQEALGEQTHLIATLRSLADTALQARAHDEAESLCQLAFTIAAEIGDHSEEAAIYYLQATIASRRQAWPQALAYADKALATFQRLGDLGFQALVLYQQSQIQLKLDKHEIAEDLALKSRTLAQSINQRYTLVYVLRHLGRVYAASGRTDTAEEVFRQALQIAERDGHLLVDALRQQLATLQGETVNRSHAASHL